MPALVFLFERELTTTLFTDDNGERIGEHGMLGEHIACRGLDLAHVRGFYCSTIRD